MSAKIRTLYAAIFTISLLVAMWGITSASKSKEIVVESLTSEAGQHSGGELVEGYKQWTRVNPVPAVFHSKIAILCAEPTARQTKMEEGNPHRNKFITVYVNDIGRHAMMEEKVPRFPQGSVIVKEKLPSKDSSAPELLTVMIKREPGYNPEWRLGIRRSRWLRKVSSCSRKTGKLSRLSHDGQGNGLHLSQLSSV